MISAIVPTFDAGAHLAGCIAALDGADEILVVDGGSSDDSVAIAEEAGARVLSSGKGRGLQLRVGAEAARGDWLLFLHADTRLAAGWRQGVEAHCVDFPDAAGCFRFRLDDTAWQARLVERGVGLRVKLLGLAYGDQGLLMARAFYERLGGFRPLTLFEDVDLVRRIGRSRLRTLAADATTSAEKWRNDGWARRSGRNLLCLGLYGLGVPPARVARIYR